MNRFIIKLAIRSIFRRKGFTAINLVGLSIGLAASLYIISFLFQEYNYDKSYENSENIYRGILEYHTGDKITKSAFLPALAGPDVADAIPEIDQFARISEVHQVNLKLENTFYKIEKLCIADEDLFSLLGHELLIGNSNSVLNQPGQIVLSESQSKRFFANENPIGKTFLQANGTILTVSGIFKDFPENSSLKTDAIISYKTVEQDKTVYLSWDGGMTFLTLYKLFRSDGLETVIPKIQNVLDQGINKKYAQSGWKLFLELQPISETHLTTNLNRDLDNNREKSFLLLIALVGAIILVLAIVNYLNLTSALAGEKSKQIGVQKLSGAISNKIILQGIAEALFTVLLASVLAILIVILAAPYFDSLLNTTVIFDPLKTGLILIAMVLITGLLSGIYPSFVLARKNILTAFKQNDFKGSRQPIRNVLVIFQFGIAVVFIIGLLTVNRQFTFLLNQNMGFNSENVLQLQLQNEYSLSKLSTLKNDIDNISEVGATTYSSQGIGNWITSNGYAVQGSEQRQLVHTLYVDENYLDFYKLSLAEGRNFYDNPEADKTAILVNQAFLKEQNWDTWLGKKVERNGTKEIVGVVDDFNFAPLIARIKPLIISKNPQSDGWTYQCLNIRLASSDIESSLKKIEGIWNKFEMNTPLTIEFIDDNLNKAYSGIATYRKIVLLFSIVALFIACIGLLGLTAYINRMRIKEIGIRKVNGATLTELLLMLMKDFAKWVVISLVLAIPVSWYLLNNWLENFVYKTTLSWWIFALAGALALGIALLTVCWQSWKTANRNPVEALRYE